MANIEIRLPNTISTTDLIETDLFTVLDDGLVNTIVPLKDLEASESILQFMYGNAGWRGYKYISKHGTTVIGYAQVLSEEFDKKGLLETEAYSYWIAEIKRKERAFKKNISLDSLSQTQYDALLSLYCRTGDFGFIGSEFRKFDVRKYIKNRQWQYVFTAFILSGHFRKQCQREARILMFADYGALKTRAITKEEGIQAIRADYPDRMMDQRAKEQAEYIYYKETNRFLPNLPQSRKRTIVEQSAE